MLLEKLIIAASALLWGPKLASFARPPFEPVEPVLPALPPPLSEPVPEKTARPKRKQIEPFGFRDRPEVLRPSEAAKVFLKWAQQGEAGHSFTAKEIDHLWDLCQEALNIAHIPYQTLRAEIAALGCCLGKRQLTLEFADIKRRTGQSRAVVYVVPTRARSLTRSPVNSPGETWASDSPSSLSHAPDHRPATPRPTAGPSDHRGTIDSPGFSNDCPGRTITQRRVGL